MIMIITRFIASVGGMYRCANDFPPTTGLLCSSVRASTFFNLMHVSLKGSFADMHILAANRWWMVLMLIALSLLGRSATMQS